MPLFGSVVAPHHCVTVRVVGRTAAPPTVTLLAVSCASSISCGSTVAVPVTANADRWIAARIGAQQIAADLRHDIGCSSEWVWPAARSHRHCTLDRRVWRATAWR